MKKNFLCVNYLIKLLCLAAFACSCNLSLLANGDGDIPDYSIDTNGLYWFGKPANTPANNGGDNLPAGRPEVTANVSESDVREINNLNLTESDLADEPGLLAKIKSKLPNLNISKEQLQKIIKIAAIAGAACVASCVGYKIVCATAETVKNVIVTTCKSAVVLAVLVLIAKYATER